MQISVSLLFSWSHLVLTYGLTSHLRTSSGLDRERFVYLHFVGEKVSAEWGTCFTMDPQSLARDIRSFSHQRIQWLTTSVPFLCCLTASSCQIVILRFCCTKILGYKAHPNFSTKLPSKDIFILPNILPNNYGNCFPQDHTSSV